MFEQFSKKPFKNRLKDTGFLLKNSFTLLGKDNDIKKPTIHMAIFSGIITTFIFMSLYTFFSGQFVIIGIILLLYTLFIAMPFRYFYEIRQKADQSWIVYNALAGYTIRYKDAHEHTKSQKNTLRFIAIVDNLIKFAGSQRNQKKGIVRFLINLFLTALVEIWDLLSHYMLPAIVIEQKPLKEIVPELKALKNNVPATLVGVFGIDFVGNVIGSLLFPLYLLFLALSVGIGHILASAMKSTVLTLAGFSFSWLPILITMYIVFVISGIYKKIIESIKVIYFTIFYTTLTRPMVITPPLRTEITNYLVMQKSDYAPQASPQTKYIDQLAQYIQQYENSNYSEEQILQFLIAQGYSQEDVHSALEKIRATR